MTDVLVVGAGPAGTAYALTAARAGASVLLAGPPPRHRPHTLELVSGRARSTLERLGLTALVTDRATPCAGVVGHWGSAAIDRPAMLDAHGGGWIVDRAVLDAGLLDAAVSAGCARSESAVESLELAGRRWRARAGGAWLHADRVVLATGRVSCLVARCGVRRPIPHRLVAVVGWVPSPLPDLGDRLHVADATDGWWYGLGHGAFTSLGFCTDLDLLRPGPDRAATTWAHALERSGWSAPDGVRPSLRLAFTGALDGQVPDGMQIVGDAALAVDPLSGHGLTLAFEAAWRASTDPAGYQSWLAEVAAVHLAQQGAFYAAAGQRGRFWERRAAAPAQEIRNP